MELQVEAIFEKLLEHGPRKQIGGSLSVCSGFNVVSIRERRSYGLFDPDSVDKGDEIRHRIVVQQEPSRKDL